MAVIDIGTVLNKFNDTYDEKTSVVKHYGIMFITADGRVRTMDARKNVKSPKQGLRQAQAPKAKGMFNLQRHGTILLEDLMKKESRTVKVATIFGFKDFNQTPFYNVRH